MDIHKPKPIRNWRDLIKDRHPEPSNQSIRK
jgi:hypothetical protein